MELKIKDLYKSYDHGKTYAINDVSADFTPGIYGILGPNGAGKSTMFGDYNLSVFSVFERAIYRSEMRLPPPSRL